MLRSALDSFHPEASVTESRHLYLKAKPSKSARICCLSDIILFRWEVTLRPWLYWKDNTVVLARTGIFISGTIQSQDIFALLKFPRPEFTVGGINLYSPTKKTQTQLLLPCQYRLAVQPQPRVTMAKECAAMPCLAKPEVGLFWPLQAFKNGHNLLPTSLSWGKELCNRQETTSPLSWVAKTGIYTALHLLRW